MSNMASSPALATAGSPLVTVVRTPDNPSGSDPYSRVKFRSPLIGQERSFPKPLFHLSAEQSVKPKLGSYSTPKTSQEKISINRSFGQDRSSVNRSFGQDRSSSAQLVTTPKFYTSGFGISSARSPIFSSTLRNATNSPSASTQSISSTLNGQQDEIDSTKGNGHTPTNISSTSVPHQEPLSQDAKSPSVAEFLKQSSKGQLKYDRRADIDLDEISTAAKSSETSAALWHSVLEEVSEEIHNLKMETLAETTSKFVEKSSKYGKRFKVTIGPNAGATREEDLLEYKRQREAKMALDAVEKAQKMRKKLKEIDIIMENRFKTMFDELENLQKFDELKELRKLEEAAKAEEARVIAEKEEKKKAEIVKVYSDLRMTLAQALTAVDAQLQAIPAQFRDKSNPVLASAYEGLKEGKTLHATLEKAVVTGSEPSSSSTLKTKVDKCTKVLLGTTTRLNEERSKIAATIKQQQEAKRQAEAEQEQRRKLEEKKLLEVKAKELEEKNKVEKLKLQQQELEAKKKAVEAEAEAAKKKQQELEKKKLLEQQALKLEQEEQKKQELEKALKLQETSQQQQPKPVARREEPSAIQSNPHCSSRNEIRSNGLMEIKKSWPSHALKADKSQSKFRINCQKAVNTNVNAINGTDATHLRERLERLSALVSGEIVPIPGNKTLNPKEHPSGLAFCLDLLAKKFVLQGDEVISEKPEMSFAYGTIISSLWAHPEVGSMFGDLFLAWTFEICPYLIPKTYPSQAEGEKTEDYFAKLGYKVEDNGDIEQQEFFIRRMNGVARLFAATCVCSLDKKKLEGQVDHPHGLGYIWKFLASALNLAPMNDITATLLVTVLEVAGNSLHTAFGGQFLKLAICMRTKYLPLIRKVTLEGMGGPPQRLEIILDKCIEAKGFIKQPVGYLNPGYL